MTVLVAAASKYGATAEIAEAIGRAQRESGVSADVRPVEQAGDLSGYAGVVLGSAVYVGRWLEPARRFVDEHADELAAKPTWLFSSGCSPARSRRASSGSASARCCWPCASPRVTSATGRRSPPGRR